MDQKRQAADVDNWVSCGRILPRDGQEVLVKGRYVLTPRRVTFCKHPAPRWEEGKIAYQLEYFEQWAALPDKPS